MQSGKNKCAREMLSFVAKSPSPFHAVKNLADELSAAGFARLSEKEPWALSAGSYFVVRNDSSIISFTIPQRGVSSFKIAAAHSDSPTFKLKEKCELKGGGAAVLNVEKYGGMLLAPWFDRPLSVAGRVALRGTADGKIAVEKKLVSIDRDLLLIPNLAIHMSRDANDGRKIDVQGEIRPVLSLQEDASLLSLVAREIGAKERDIISHDLFLYAREKGTFWGAKNEFVAGPRLDDLACVWATARGFLDAGGDGSCHVHAVFDSEEVGSGSRQGADSTFLSDTLRRISLSLGKSEAEHLSLLSRSFMVSADNAHALHPNYAGAADEENRPTINGGVVIKFNAAQKYTTDALSAAVFKLVCEKAGVPFQVFANNSNISGGSTLGNISLSHVSVPCVDIGIAQWAMHSPLESAGAKDVEFMARAMKAFYETEIETREGK